MATETAGVALHYDAPSNRAPQVALLAVPPDVSVDRPWSLDLVARIDRRGARPGSAPRRHDGRAARRRRGAAGAVPAVRRHRRTCRRSTSTAWPTASGRPSSCWGRTDVSASIVTWSRLEPVDQSSDLSVSLAAPIADPLWMLHRQWQFGELEGNDAGTPIEVRIEHRAVPLSRLRLGAMPRTPSTTRRASCPSSRSSRRSACAASPAGIAGWPRRPAPSWCGCCGRRELDIGGCVRCATGISALLVPPSPDPIADPLGAEAAVLLVRPGGRRRRRRRGAGATSRRRTAR